MLNHFWLFFFGERIRIKELSVWLSQRPQKLTIFLRERVKNRWLFDLIFLIFQNLQTVLIYIKTGSFEFFLRTTVMIIIILIIIFNLKEELWLYRSELVAGFFLRTMVMKLNNCSDNHQGPFLYFSDNCPTLVQIWAFKTLEIECHNIHCS
jgi:hypothetical protein